MKEYYVCPQGVCSLMGKAAVFKIERKTQIDRQKLDYNVCISDCVKYVTKGITIYSTPLYPSEKDRQHKWAY